MSQQVDAFIAAQAALRARSGAAMGARWDALPNHDASSVPTFVTAAALIAAATRAASVRLTSAFLARRLGLPPLGIDPSQVVIRNGITPAEIYRRPFVNVWSDLKQGKSFADAVRSGRDRAVSSVQMDAQLAMRQTLVTAASREPLILGYRRVPDAGACAFCVLIAGQRYTTDQLMPVHNHCGCGVDVITEANRGDFTGKRENDLNVTRDGVTAAVVEHGELGPLVVNGADHFTDHAALAA